ncbi:unnamed protein product, partial [Clonostachys rosea f. rosea IK726]
PNVLFLQDELESKFGEGCARVICPITDPFVKHHGALGSFVRVHVSENAAQLIPEMAKHCQTFPQVEVAMLKDEAAQKCETPIDREGDFVAISSKNAVIGAKAKEHDLTVLKGHRLRSHGRAFRAKVPLLMSHPSTWSDEAGTEKRTWRNFDIFDLVLTMEVARLSPVQILDYFE